MRSPLLLRGLPVSRGVARGRARCITSASELLELDGPTVLVLQSPMTKWMPWPAEVVAIASKRGGALCASATIARERRIPAVFGLGEPLDTRIDGLTVEVDGCQGTLSLLCDDLQTAVWRHVGLMPAREFPA